MWADDQWLVKHAGATLKNTDGEDADGEEADSAGEKNTEANTETVSNYNCFVLGCDWDVHNGMHEVDN